MIAPAVPFLSGWGLLKGNDQIRFQLWNYTPVHVEKSHIVTCHRPYRHHPLIPHGAVLWDYRYSIQKAHNFKHIVHDIRLDISRHIARLICHQILVVWGESFTCPRLGVGRTSRKSINVRRRTRINRTRFRILFVRLAISDRNFKTQNIAQHTHSLDVLGLRLSDLIGPNSGISASIMLLFYPEDFGSSDILTLPIWTRRSNFITVVASNKSHIIANYMNGVIPTASTYLVCVGQQMDRSTTFKTGDGKRKWCQRYAIFTSSSTAWTCNPFHHRRTKHIDIKYNYPSRRQNYHWTYSCEGRSFIAIYNLGFTHTD